MDDGQFEVGHRRPPVGGAALEGQAVWIVCSSSWVVATAHCLSGARAAMSTPLRCRDNELASLREQFARLRTAVGTIWLIEGGAGLGKSRLLAEVVSTAREAGFAVGHGMAEPADATVQVAALMEVLFGGSTPLLERNALGDLHSSPERRYWLLQDIQRRCSSRRLRADGLCRSMRASRRRAGMPPPDQRQKSAIEEERRDHVIGARRYAHAPGAAGSPTTRGDLDRCAAATEDHRK